MVKDTSDSDWPEQPFFIEFFIRLTIQNIDIINI